MIGLKLGEDWTQAQKRLIGDNRLNLARKLGGLKWIFLILKIKLR
ncbi:hypothetical protein C8C77_10546 [Halanaerobium saccharolyticum]|jgi:hypothetical protein|uniref:Uncharacterized protein n=1 Tax=Halanaerobium saccharolyticum TaxID=43595 RepID=A0A4R7Z5K6_9FIRM|nr:hypothetical protein C7958_10146 [Halanaerobium saccharolyticum]TDW06410.1 hypothetical protein C8C77_10546 [Halanaerobium saccharolyticum]TDX61658.1 hypothetical protein C7956_10546 [Halanaerobium saccharolyticum]